MDAYCNFYFPFNFPFQIVQNSLYQAATQYMKQSIPILYLFFQSTLCLFGQNKQTILDQYFTTLAKNQQFNGNILVSEKGNIIYERSFGFADITHKISNSVNTSSPVASLSKTFTATGILQLAQSGKFRLTDPIHKYLPRFPTQTSLFNT